MRQQAYTVLARLSAGYPILKGRLPMYSSPVRHFTTRLPRILVRLACVRRAASVRSEPGSNSQKNYIYKGRHFNTLCGLYLQLFKCQRTSAQRRTLNISNRWIDVKERLMKENFSSLYLQILRRENVEYTVVIGRCK